MTLLPVFIEYFTQPKRDAPKEFGPVWKKRPVIGELFFELIEETHKSKNNGFV